MQNYDTSTIQSEGREIQIPREETSRTDQSCEGAGEAKRAKRTRPIPELSENDKARFFSKIAMSATTGRAEWIGRRHDDKVLGRGKGYGVFDIGGIPFLAHRVAFFLAHDTDPGDLCVCHRSDDKGSVHPADLFLGTHTDNMRDRSSKGRCNQPRGDSHYSRLRPDRLARGERNGSAKIRDSDIPSILSDTRSYSVIAAERNASWSTISRIKSGETRRVFA